jgi:F-type H+-transporting ATPase subunit delta
VAAHSAAARSYAKALFGLAKERGVVDAVARELHSVVATVTGEAELQTFFARPWISANVKRKVAMDIATRLGVSTLVRDFLALVASRGRASQLDQIAAAFREDMDRDLGRVRARVRTAIPLSANEKSALGAKLSRALDGKQVLLEEVVDPGLLGGFVAEIGSLIVDGSLDGQLARMHERLATA